MLYHCLLNSLSKEAKTKVQLFQAEYIVMNDNGTIVPSGNLLLKIIVRESHLDTNATTTSIRRKLSSLDKYINTINNDVTKFNAYVKGLLMALSARGERTEDLLSNLFKGYKAVSDRTFIRYIDTKIEKYEEGEDLNPETLMQLANNKYKVMKENDTWEAPSAEEEKIMALQAEVRRMQKSGKSSRKREAPRSEKSSSSPSARRGESRNITSINRAGEWKEKPDWMFVMPNKAEIAKPKKWRNKDWW